MDKTDTIKRNVLDSLEKSLGVVTTAVKKAGIARSTFYEWLNNDLNFAKEVADIQNVALDFAESQLHKQIGDGSTTATIFYLKTKGKNRGYIETRDNRGRGREIVSS
jgi:hypothetical protein